MVSTFTPNKGYEKQGTGDNPGEWGQFLNDNATSIVDSNLGGVVSKTLSNGNVELTNEEARAPLLRLNGTLTGNVQINTPAQGFLCVENLTAGAFMVSLYNGFGAPVTGPQGRRYFLFSDPVNATGIRGITSVSSSAPLSIPIGTKMLFPQTAVPTGWTLDGALNDYGLMIGGTGNVTAGNIDWSVVFAQTAAGGTALTESTMPAHNHTLTIRAAGGNPTGNFGHWNSRSAITATGVVLTLQSTGGGVAHSHNIDLRVKTCTVLAGVRAA